MKRETLILKIVVFLMAIPVLALCIFWLPVITGEAAQHYPRFLPVCIVMYSSAIPFIFTLYQALRLLGYIDKNKAFSELSVTALKKIKYCAIIISILYLAVSPLLYSIAQLTDAPGILAIGLVIVFASFAIALFAAVLQKLLKNAIDIKSENDLTI